IDDLPRHQSLADVVLGDDHDAGAAERGIPSGVIEVEVGVDQEAHRLRAHHGQCPTQLRRHGGDIRVDDQGAVGTRQYRNVSPGAEQHVQVVGQFFTAVFDLGGVWRLRL